MCNFLVSNFCIQGAAEPGTITVSLLESNNEFLYTIDVKQTCQSFEHDSYIPNKLKLSLRKTPQFQLIF